MKKSYAVKIKDLEKSKVFGLKITYFIGVILGILVLATVFVTIETSAAGAELAVLEKEEALLNKERVELKSKIVRSTSLSKISEAAKDLDLKKVSKIIYITEEEIVAKLP